MLSNIKQALKQSIKNFRNENKKYTIAFFMV